MGQGANWIAKTLSVSPSLLGSNVADLFDEVFAGIYHLPMSSLKKTDWTDTYCLRFVFHGGLATVDSGGLTFLVVRAHDRFLRMNIAGCGPKYLEMLFHQRYQREGSISLRCPRIESVVSNIRLSKSMHDVTSIHDAIRAKREESEPC